MQSDFQKVNSEQIFALWRNVAVSMLVMIMVSIFVKLLPSLFAPLVSTFFAIVLYYQVMSGSYRKFETCMIVPYIFFMILVTYTVVLVGINVLNLWGIVQLPNEMIFFEDPYVQTLIISPIGFITSIIVYLCRKRLPLCVNCKLTNGLPIGRGRVGLIYSNESSFQMRNIIVLYGIITTIVYTYYLTEFVDITITSRDIFVFVGIIVFIYLLDIAYFTLRYYNLYLDMKERNELLTPTDISQQGIRTYVRFYVICGDSVYMAPIDAGKMAHDESDIIDTPFIIKRSVNGIQEYEIKRYIERETGVKDGELRFFYGKELADSVGRKVLRYFYFLPGEIEDYPELEKKGEWISSEKLKTIYNYNPDRLTSVCLSDISRIALVMITSKTYHSNGERRNKLTYYRPSFSLREIHDKNIDFQDDKWIRVYMFNSDTSFFHFKRWWRQHLGRTYYE